MDESELALMVSREKPGALRLERRVDAVDGRTRQPLEVLVHGDHVEGI